MRIYSAAMLGIAEHIRMVLARHTVDPVLYAASQQRHPEKPMYWDRSKSTDHLNKIMRHLVDCGKFDDKGQRHSAMAARGGLGQLARD